MNDIIILFMQIIYNGLIHEAVNDFETFNNAEV